MAANLRKGTSLRRLLGVCVPTSKQNAAKVRITRLELNKYLLMYFSKTNYIYAHDPKKLCKPGDTVLIRNMREPLTLIIDHEILEVVYPVGDITDPITGKKLLSQAYRDDIIEEAQAFGESASRFDHNKPRPTQGIRKKRDFTDAPTYVRYTDDPEDSDPYAIDRT